MHLGKKRRCLFFLLCFLFVFTLCGAGNASAADMVARAKSNGKSVARGKIVTDKNGVRYRFTKDKTYAKNKWLEIKGVVYYFDSKGYAKTGSFQYRGKSYYAGPKGRIYYSRWATRQGKRYYYLSDGTMAKNTFVVTRSKKYRFSTSGTLITYKMFQVKGKWYFAGKDGVLLTNKWMKTTSGKRYYFDQNGVRLSKQWVFYKGKFYYLQKDGNMAVSKTIGKYKVGSDGARIVKNRKYLFVGDSRIVGMSQAVSDSKTSFIGKVSMGYSWMVSTALPEVYEKLKEDPTLYVVFCFGINDLGNISNYLSKYKSVMNSYKYANFFFMAVNPIAPQTARANGYSVTNAEIEAFNAKLKAAMDFRYIDTYTWLTKKGFDTADGIHYTSSTYQRIYSYTISQMG